MLLTLRGITKSFGATRALAGVDFDIRAGEAHVLLGENGAGKTTLINIICGALQPDAGEILLGDARTTRFTSVADARRLGVSAMFQEFSLAQDLTVRDNILLNSEPLRLHVFLNKGEAKRRVDDLLASLGFHLRSDALVRDLSRAEQQMVELAKALLSNPRVLILDEPTASLTEHDVERILSLVEELKRRGVGIIYITHRMAEIHRIADRITVMRDGQSIATVDVESVSRDRLVQMMTGRAPQDLYPVIRHTPSRVALKVDDLATLDGKVSDISFEVRAGEIVGFAGLVGCGKSNIGRACFGLEEISSGSVALAGDDLTGLSPQLRMKRGLCFIPSDRRREGLFLDRPTRENLTMTALDQPELSQFGVVRRFQELSVAQRLGKVVGLHPMRLDAPSRVYSGGNQQKIVLARAFSRDVKVCIFDEPTVGIDVGARREFYDMLGQLLERGMAIVLISSELSEIVGLSHRVYVVHEGRITASLKAEQVNEEAIAQAFFPEHPADSGASQATV